MDLDYTRLGQRIANRRKEKGLRQNAVAEKIGISNNYLSGIECGKERPSLEVFISICNALEVTPDDLLMGNMHSDHVPQSIIDGLQLCTGRKERSSLSAELEELYSARNKMEAEYSAANLSISKKIHSAQLQYRELLNGLDILMDKKPSAVRVDRSADTMICPICGVRQRSTRKVCFSCGVSFVD